MALSTATVGQTITSTIWNAIIALINALGATLATPTSVAGAGVSLSGSKVVVAAASTVSVNGCFTSTYSTYDVIINLTTSGSATIAMTLRLAGTDAATAYDKLMQRAVTTTTIVQALNQASWLPATLTVTGKHIAKIRLHDPFTAVATTGMYEYAQTANPMTAADGAISNGTVQHRTLTAYDGFTLTASTGTLTGSVWIVGIA